MVHHYTHQIAAITPSGSLDFARKVIATSPSMYPVFRGSSVSNKASDWVFSTGSMSHDGVAAGTPCPRCIVKDSDTSGEAGGVWKGEMSCEGPANGWRDDLVLRVMNEFWLLEGSPTGLVPPGLGGIAGVDDISTGSSRSMSWV